jgi:hypothetical protein
LEENVAEMKKCQIKQEADFVEALQKHSVGLKSMKSEVNNVVDFTGLKSNTSNKMTIAHPF